jgi:hypothetical protein
MERVLPRRFFGWFAALVLAVGLGLTGRADIYRAVGKGNTIVPVRSTQVTMEAETVLVEPEADFGGFKVTAAFTMRNRSEQTTGGLVAFPVETERHAAVMRDGFKVHIGPPGGELREVVAVIKERSEIETTPPLENTFDFAAAFVWDVTWTPHETKIIRVTYAMGEPDFHGGFVRGWALRYIVRTGALWAGPIGRADIAVRFSKESLLGSNLKDHLDRTGEKGQPPFSYPKNVRLTDQGDVTWHFENWTPDEDMWVGVLTWAGFGPEARRESYIRLPDPYQGAVVAYTDELLEQMTNRELAPWRKHFPVETVRDRGLLKTWIADWLRHEIFARHGDGFYLGKRKEGEPQPPGAAGYDRNDNYYSEWSALFAPSRVRFGTGWYQPGTGPGPGGSVRLEDLSPLERQNAEFLQRVISQTR